MIYTDRFMVATIESYIPDAHDLMIGTRTRLLFELRAEELLGQALPQPPQPQRDARGWPILGEGSGVVELPDGPHD